MINIENTKVFGWEAAIRGMRNPMNSWNKSDSGWCYTYKRVNDQLCLNCPWNINNKCMSDNQTDYIIGPNDLKLMKNLAKAGSDHRKFMRMIAVQVDITAPLYW